MFKLLFSYRSKSILQQNQFMFATYKLLYIQYHKAGQNTNPCPAKLCKCPLQKNRQNAHQNGVRSYFPGATAVFRVQKSPSGERTGFFAHEAGYRLCSTWVTAVKENSRRRRTRARYPQKKTRRKRSHTQQGLLPLL